MKIFLFISFIFLGLFSCKKSIEPEITASGPSVVTVPGSPDLHTFNITLINLTATSAEFEWTNAGDYQSDSVRYTLILDNIEIATKIKITEFLISGLKPATKYQLQIRAYASDHNYVMSTYDFTTHDGYIKFAKSLYTNVDPYDIALAPDNGYLISIFNASRDNLLLAKVDTLGNEIWRKMYPYKGILTKIRVTKGGYLILGNDYILKVDFGGNKVWYKSFEGTGTWFSSFTEAGNGDIVVTGLDDVSTSTIILQASVIRFNAAGTIKWRKRYGHSLSNNGIDIIPAENGVGYFVLGSMSIPVPGNTEGNGQYWVFKIDEDGNFIWEKNLGDSRYDFPVQIKRLNNNLIIGGFSTPAGGSSYEIQVFRTDLSGNLLKAITVREPGFDNRLYAVEPTSDNGYVVCAAVSAGGPGYTLGLFKYDASDQLTWSKTYSGGFNYSSKSNAIKQTADKGFILPATKFESYRDKPNLWLLKLNPSGSYE